MEASIKTKIVFYNRLCDYTIGYLSIKETFKTTNVLLVS